jgi:hypothetical protein
MLLGLLTTILYIPRNESSQLIVGQVKTLEEWAIGRATPNRFAEHRLSKILESGWRICATIGRWMFGLADRMSRDEQEHAERQPEREMGEFGEGNAANGNQQLGAVEEPAEITERVDNRL